MPVAADFHHLAEWEMSFSLLAYLFIYCQVYIVLNIGSLWIYDSFLSGKTLKIP